MSVEFKGEGARKGEFGETTRRRPNHSLNYKIPTKRALKKPSPYVSTICHNMSTESWILSRMRFASSFSACEEKDGHYQVRACKCSAIDEVCCTSI